MIETDVYKRQLLYRTYLSLFSGERSTVFHMKELWSYLSRLFEDSARPLKKIRKADRSAPYEAAVEEMFARPLRRDALWEDCLLYTSRCV